MNGRGKEGRTGIGGAAVREYPECSGEWYLVNELQGIDRGALFLGKHELSKVFYAPVAYILHLRNSRVFSKYPC
jgi:hypothetical protein